MATNATQNPTTTSPPPPTFPTTGSPQGQQQGQQQGRPFGEQGDQAKQGKPREGETAKKIEQQTAKVPSDAFLWAAVGAMGTSLILRTAQQKQASLFFGQWVSPLLLFGVYNKLVKLGGSDRFSR